MPRPVEVNVKVFGWMPGASEVELSIPEGSDLARLLAGASPEEAALLFARLRRHVVAELTDALATLEWRREPAATSS